MGNLEPFEHRIEEITLVGCFDGIVILHHIGGRDKIHVYGIIVTGKVDEQRRCRHLTRHIIISARKAVDAVHEKISVVKRAVRNFKGEFTFFINVSVEHPLIRLALAEIFVKIGTILRGTLQLHFRKRCRLFLCRHLTRSYE